MKKWIKLFSTKPTHCCSKPWILPARFVSTAEVGFKQRILPSFEKADLFGAPSWCSKLTYIWPSSSGGGCGTADYPCLCGATRPSWWRSFANGDPSRLRIQRHWWPRTKHKGNFPLQTISGRFDSPDLLFLFKQQLLLLLIWGRGKFLPSISQYFLFNTSQLPINMQFFNFVYFSIDGFFAQTSEKIATVSIKVMFW